MERLIRRNERGKAYFPHCFREDTCNGMGSDKCASCGFLLKVCETLAAYEDNAGEPEIRNIENSFSALANGILEYVCDKRCKIPTDTEYTQEDVDEICGKCEFGNCMKLFADSDRITRARITYTGNEDGKRVTPEELICLVNSMDGEFIINIMFDEADTVNMNTDNGGEGLDYR